MGAASSTARVLVVDDDPDARAALTESLRDHGVVVVAGTASGPCGSHEPVDLVLVALAAAGDGGAVRQLRALPATANAAFIVVCPAAGADALARSLEDGADDFLVAPYSSRELLRRLEASLELARLRRIHTQEEREVVELRGTVRVRDEFLSTAAHELRTPITTLALQTDGLLQLCARAPAADDRLPRRLTSIRHQVTRLDQMVDQLLDVSRMLEGRLELRPELVDLHDLALDAIELLREPAKRAGSSVTLLARPGVVGHWDKFRVGQVITNLVGNAIKFGGGQPIEVELAADADHARLAVRDSGVGIAPEEQRRIFERFERAASSAGQPGLGLGLWISKQIVDACRGTISIDSQRGKGCTFTVQLPRGS